MKRQHTRTHAHTHTHARARAHTHTPASDAIKPAGEDSGMYKEVGDHPEVETESRREGGKRKQRVREASWWWVNNKPYH